MIYSLLIEEDTLSSEIIYSICFSLLGFLVIYFLVKIYETAYVYRKKSQFMFIFIRV